MLGSISLVHNRYTTWETYWTYRRSLGVGQQRNDGSLWLASMEPAKQLYVLTELYCSIVLKFVLCCALFLLVCFIYFVCVFQLARAYS
jgi:hypothetical protein